MKTIKPLLILTILFSVLILPFACKKKIDDPDPEPQPEGVIVADETRVMDLVTRAAILSIDTTDFTFKFSETELVANLNVGDILVDSASEFAKYGYLRKITSIADTKGETTVYTEPAGLTEAVLQGSIDFSSGILRMDQVDRMVLAEGVSLSNAKGTEFTVFDMDYEMEFADGDDKLTIQGSTSLAMEVFFKFDWDYCILCLPPDVEIELFESGIEINQGASININSQYGASINKTIPFATFYFEPWTFTVGPIPIVFVPKVELFISVDGSVTAEFSTGASESFNGRLGTRYTSDNGWSMIKERTFNYDYFPPELDLAASIEAGVGPEVSLMLYGVAGPYTNVIACTKLEAELHTGTNNWDLDYKVGVKAGAGIKIDVLLFEDSWGDSICLFEHTLMHLENEPMETGVFFEKPVDGAWLNMGSDVLLEVRVTGASPSELEFLVDGNMIGTSQGEPWTYTWNTASSTYGEHELIVNDIISGIIVDSDTINVSLVNAVWEVVDLTDLGQSVETINTDIFFSSETEGWMSGGSAYGLAGYLLHTTNSGDTWENIAPHDLFPRFDQILFMNEDEILMRTITGDVLTSKYWNDITWTEPTQPPTGGLTYGNSEVNSIALSASGYLMATANWIGETEYTIRRAQAATNDYQPEAIIEIPYYYDDFPSHPEIYFRNDLGIVYDIKDQSNPLRQYIMISEDGGVSWESMQLNASGITREDDIEAAFFMDENRGWLVGRENQGYAVVLRTDDGGNTWEKYVVEEAINFGSVWFIDNNEGYATVNAYDNLGFAKNKLFHTQDGGVTWESVDISETIVPMKKVFFKGPNLGFTVGQGAEIYKFTLGK